MEKNILHTHNLGLGLQRQTNKLLGVKVDNSGNVDLSLSDKGLKAEVTFPEIIHTTATKNGDTITITNADNSKVEFDLDNGFSCESLNELPERTWSNGSILLAKDKLGSCYRLKPSSSLFTDVTISITSDSSKVTVNKGEKVTKNLIINVTNSGKDTATDVEVTIVKPLLGSYTIKNPTTRAIKASNVVQNSNTSFTIGSIESGGGLTIELPVEFNAGGTYSFGGQVTSLIDTDESNNTASYILSVTEVSQSNYTPTIDCPLFTVVDNTLNKELRTLSPNLELSKAGGTETHKFINAYGDVNGLANRSFTISGAEQLLITMTHGSSRRGWAGYNGTASTTADRVLNSTELFRGSRDERKNTSVAFTEDFSIGFDGSYSYSASNDWENPDLYITDILLNQLPVIPTSKYTFDKGTGILTFGSDFTNDLSKRNSADNPFAINIWARPTSANCRWQVCTILFASSIPESWKQTTPILSHVSSLGSDVEFNYFDKDDTVTLMNPSGQYVYNWVTTPITLQAIQDSSLIQLLDESRIFSTKSRVEVIIKKGISGSFTITATDNRLIEVETSGGINTTYSPDNKTITVTLNNPQVTDSIKFKYVNFKVID